MNETLQIIHEAYKKHQFRLSTKRLLLGGLGFALLNMVGVYFLGIPAIPIKITNPITFLFDLVYNVIMFILIQNSTIFLTIFLKERDAISTSIQSSLSHSKKRMIGYYEIEEKIEEIQDQVISIGAYLASLGKVTDAEQLASVLYHIDEELKKIPKLQSKIEELNKLKPRVKKLEENEVNYNRIIADQRKTIFKLEMNLKEKDDSKIKSDLRKTLANLFKPKKVTKKLKGE